MTPYFMVLLLVLSLPMIKILVVCALSYVQHSYAPFNMLETLWFSIFISGSCTIAKGQLDFSCSSVSLCYRLEQQYLYTWKSEQSGNADTRTLS